MPKKSIKHWLVWLWDCISGGADFYRAVIWLFPSLGGVVTAWLALVSGLPSYLIAILSLAAICLCSLTVAAIHYVIRYRAIFERLRYVKTEPQFVNPDKTKNTLGIFFKCELMNMSQTRSIYISLRRGDARLQGRTNPDPILLGDVFIVPPFSSFSLNTAAVPDIDVAKEIKGKLEIEVAYGPSQDDLPYMLTYEFHPTLDIQNLTDSGAQVMFTGPLKKYEHKRI